MTFKVMQINRLPCHTGSQIVEGLDGLVTKLKGDPSPSAGSSKMPIKGYYFKSLEDERYEFGIVYDSGKKEKREAVIELRLNPSEHYTSLSISYIPNQDLVPERDAIDAYRKFVATVKNLR